jgi:hypothetical protein
MMSGQSIFARELRLLEEMAASDLPPWEKLAALKCHYREDDDPVAQVLRSSWGRANPGLAARLTKAIEEAGRVGMLGTILRSDFGRSNPERACQLALAGSKFTAAEVANWDDYMSPPIDLEEERTTWTGHTR